MQIVKDRGLLARVYHPERITDSIAKSKVIKKEGDIYEVLIHWDLENAQTLAGIGLKNVVSTIDRDYKYTGMYKPFDHQKKTASFLTLHKKAFCFNEQGTGKTMSVIWACDYLMKMKQIRRVLIVCPLSIMQSAWQNDIMRTTIHRTCDIAYGSAEKRKKIFKQNAEFTIINFDGVEILEDYIKYEGGFDLIIIDEANAYKNPQTKRWKCMNKIIQANPNMKLWMLTGTPAAQSPVDAYGLAKLVNANKVPRFLGAWKDKVMLKVSQFTWIPKSNSSEQVHRVLQPAIRFTKEECMDLPDITFQTRKVPLTKQQQKYYNDIRKKMYIEAADEDISAVNAAALMQKLLQISCGAVYSDTRETVRFDAKDRLKVIKEIIDETSHKALIFVPFRNAIEMVSEFLAKKKISNAIINGAVSATKRADIFNKFQTEDDLKVLIIQPQSASHGVTLTKADTVIWFGPTTSLETYIQANARVHRAGQVNKTTVINIEGSAIEKRIYTLLKNKENIHNQMIDLYKQEIN